MEVFQPDGDRAAAVRADPEQYEADELADDRRQRRAAHAHVEREDQQRIEADVDDRTGDNAEHRVNGVRLIAHLVVQHQRGGHVRRADEDEAHVIADVGERGLRRAQHVGQRIQPDQSHGHDHEAGDQRREEARRRHLLGVLVVVRAERAGDVVAGTMAKEEAHRLNDRHQRIDDADARCGARVLQHADEKGVGHVVKRGDQHADDRWNRQLTDELFDGGLGHPLEFLLLSIVHGASLLFRVCAAGRRLLMARFERASI